MNIRRILGANVASQASGILIQLLSIPVFLKFWDTQTYGTWITYSAIPSYLALSDFGLFLAGSNNLIRERASHASDIQTSAEFPPLVAFSSILLVAVLSICIVANALLETTQTTIISLLALYTVFSILMNLPAAILKAENMEPTSIYLLSGLRLLELPITAGILYHSDSMVSLASGLTVYRGAALALTVLLISRRFHFYTWIPKPRQLLIAIGIARHSIVSQGLPLAHALNAQGTLLIVSHMLGPAIAAAYNICRQASRIVIQVACIIPNSFWSSFVRLYAKNDSEGFRHNYKRAQRFTLFGALLIALLFNGIAPYLIPHWSSGKIQISFESTLILSISATIYCISNVSVIALLAKNSFKIPAVAAISSSATALVLIFSVAHQTTNITWLFFCVLLAELLQLLIIKSNINSALQI